MTAFRLGALFRPDPSSSAALPETEDEKTPWVARGHNALWILLLLWLECALVWIYNYAPSFAELGFRDPDDAMRMVQVRDFLAGQSWFDVSQHRVNPPVGGPMHWSRLVDLPIAGLILLLRPLLGTHLAEIVASVSVPLLTLWVILWGFYTGIKPLLGIPRSLLAAALLVTSFPILIQTVPLRIDHHAWQIAMATGLLLGLLHPDARKGGWIMGGAIAIWLDISSEGLPYAAFAGAVLALRYAARPEEGPRLFRYVGLLAGGSLALLLLTHGVRAGLVDHCDAMSPVYLGPLLLLAGVMALIHRVAGDASALRRLAPVALGGAAAAGLFLLDGGACLAGPFRTLDPLVYTYWYLGVSEGRPIWEQTPSIIGIEYAPIFVGLLGLALATWAEKDRERRFQWLSLDALALGAAAVAIMVLRATSVVQLLALPGLAWIIAALHGRIRAIPLMTARVLVSCSLAALSPVGIALIANESIAKLTHAKPPRPFAMAYSHAEIGALGALPTSTLFAEIDISPDILLRTPHSVIATGHHRNALGIGKVIGAFIAPPEKALPIILSTRARYVVLAPDINETGRYKHVAPNGLMARLMKGRPPTWLTPVHLPHIRNLKVYRIDRNAH